MQRMGWKEFVRGDSSLWHFLASASVVIAIGKLQWHYVVDDGYIYAKFATCLAHSGNWSFNCESEPVYATTSPLWTLILTLFEVVRADLTFGIPLLNWTAAFLLALAVGVMFQASSVWTRVLAVSSISALPLIWMSQGLDVVLAVALVAWTVVAFSRGKEQLAGILLGLSILARPDSAIAAPILLGAAVLKDRRVPVRAILWAIAIVLPWLCFSGFTFGSVIPSTLEAKTTQRDLSWWKPSEAFLPAAHGMVQQLSRLLVPLGLIGITLSCISSYKRQKFVEPFRIDHDLSLLVFAAYGILHGVAYGMLDVPSAYFWYQIPFVTGVLCGAFLGVSKISQIVKNKGGEVKEAIVGISLGSMLFAQCWGGALSVGPEYRLSDEYRAAGEFIRQSAAKGDRVAAAEIGYIGYFGDLNILDIHGLIHNESRGAIRSGNWLWWLEKHPEWIVVHSPRWYGEPGYMGFAEDYLENGYQKASVFSSQTAVSIEVWKRSTLVN